MPKFKSIKPSLRPNKKDKIKGLNMIQINKKPYKRLKVNWTKRVSKTLRKKNG
jgi:hypothetical protein